MARDSSYRSPSWLGVPLKTISISTLTLQSSLLVLLVHYSRIMPPVKGQRFLPSTAVLLAEIIKLSVSLTMALYDITAKHPNLPATTVFTNLMRSMFALDSWKLALPALLGVLHNTCRYLALTNIDPISYAVTYQMRLILAAVFGLTFLRKPIGMRKGMSLLLLFLGILVIQVPHGPRSLAKLKDGSSTSYFWPRSLEELGNLGSGAAQQLSRRVLKRSATYQGIEEDTALHHPRLDPGLGLIAVLAATLFSAASGTYLEGVLRESNVEQELIGGNFGTGTWIRNVQLSFFSIIAAMLGGIIYKDGSRISRNGFFAGYDAVVWVTVFVQALGSIGVALVVNYSKDADRHLASCISIFICLLGSLLIFDTELSFTYIFGSAVVIGGLWLYTSHEGKKRPPVIQVADYEKSSGPSSSGDYFSDVESRGGPARSPLKDQGLSTSRPSTPLGHRHHFRTASGRRYNSDHSV